MPQVTAVASAKPISRLGVLDGLRGWAALGVLIFHLSWETFGVRFPVFRSLAATVLTGGGGLALSTFFVTSGYLLTIRRWRVEDDRRLWLQLVKRYVRLTVPILASALIFWAVVALHLTATEAAGAIVHREDWLTTFGDVKPNLLFAVAFAFWYNYSVWFVPPFQSYGPFLWTMAIQWWGSVLVLPIAYGARALREPYSPLLLLIVFLLYAYPPVACMPLGALLALLEKDGVLFRRAPSPIGGVVATMAFFACIVASAMVEPMRAPHWREALILQALISALFVAATLRSVPLETFLTNRLSLFLGKISFPLYLVQCALLISLTSWLIVVTNNAGLLTVWSALAIVLVSIAVTVAASWAFLPVERFASNLVRLIDRPFRKPSPAGA